LSHGCGNGNQGRTIDSKAGTVLDLLWSADGSEVFYLSQHGIPPGPHGAPTSEVSVRAARTDGSGTRIVDSGKPGYGKLFQPPDGSSVYYLAGDPSNWALFDAVNSHQVASFAAGEVVLGFAASPDDRHIAYFSNGALRQLDVTDGSSVELVPAPPSPGLSPSTIVYSPAGDRIFSIVFDGSGAASGVTLDLTTKALAPDAGQAQRVGFPSWSAAEGLRVVWMASNDRTADVMMEDVASRQLTTLWRPPHAGGFGGWSPDGTAVGFWDVACAGGDFGFGCPNTTAQFYVVSIDSGAATRVDALANADGPVAFSNDARRLAYGDNEQLHVVDLR
jgi:hypothetical protein